MAKNICGLIVWLALSLLARSETYYVATNGVDTQSGIGGWANAVLTISNAAALASTSDEVLVSNGTYVLTAEINIARAMTIRGFNGYSNTIVDGNYPAYSNRCFYLNLSGTVLDGLTISNGCATNYDKGGGGVYINAGSLTNCLIINNRAITNGQSQASPRSGGGGVSCADKNVLIYNCRIIGNMLGGSQDRGGGGGMNGSYYNCEVISNIAARPGGGIYVNGAGTIISNCVIMYNMATNSGMGGGGINFVASGQVLDCTIAMNSAGNAGGGIGFSSPSSASISGSYTALHCNVYGNIALNYAGGISTYNVFYALIDRCSISNNVATAGTSGNGGGVYLSSNSFVNNCLIISNKHALRDGGGVYAYGYVTIQSCTIAGNQAPNGGGIYLARSNNLVVNTIAWSNIATAGVFSNVYNTTAEQSNSYRYCNTSITLPDASNITNNPRFLNAAGFNYRLDGNSPCINTGSNQDWMTGALDLDGYSRIDKFNRRVDMGCYEYIPKGTMFRFH